MEKKMTREAAIELLKNRKVYVNGRSKEIQEKLFELGFEWVFNGNEVICEEYPFIMIGNDNTLYVNYNMKMFSEDARTEISYEEILAIEVEPDCPFKPFDKVLMRDEDSDEWRPFLFWKKVSSNNCPYVAISDVGYSQCIPYEGHEHLIGTTKSPEE